MHALTCTGNVPAGTGHTASVTHIALDERLNQVFTLAVDKTIKVTPSPLEGG